MNLFGYLVQGVSDHGLPLDVITDGLQHFFQLAVDHFVMGISSSGSGMQLQLVGKQAQPHSVALAFEDLHQYCCRIDREEDFVRLCEGVFLPFREVHGRGVVNDQMAAKVCLFLILFDEKLVCPGIKFPVDMSDGLAGVVGPVFGKLHGKAVHGALVYAGDESFHNLFCHKLHVVELGDFCQIDCICHSRYF